MILVTAFCYVYSYLFQGRTSTDKLKKRFGGPSPLASRISLNQSCSNLALNTSALQLNALAMAKLDRSNGGMEMMPIKKDSDKTPLIKNSVAPINGPEIAIDVSGLCPF
jgi:hypothetical protein